MFDWLINGIVDYIIETFSGLTANVEALSSLARVTPSAFDPSLWKSIVSFNNIAVLPVAKLLFGIFLMSDFVQLMNRQQADGLEAIRLAITVAIKLAIGQVLLANIPYLIDSIFDIAAHILQNADAFIASNHNITSIQVSDALENADILTILMLAIQAGLIRFANYVCNMICILIINLRYLEIYVLVGVAALPIATLISSNKEINIIGIGFIKRLSALALQVVFILIVLTAYTTIINNNAITVTDNNIETSLFSYLGYSLLLVIALFQTGSWSKALFQVH